MRSGCTPQASRCAPTPSEVTNGHAALGRVRASSDSRGGRSGRATRSRGPPAAIARRRTGTGLEALGGRRAATATRAGPPNRIGQHAKSPRPRSAPLNGRATWREGRWRAALAQVSSGFHRWQAALAARAARHRTETHPSVGIDAFGSRKPWDDRLQRCGNRSPHPERRKP